MNTPSWRARCVQVVAAFWLLGCGALSSAGDPGAARYFAIEPTPAQSPATPAAAPMASGNPEGLHLARVTGAPHLAERVVFRESPHEVGYYREVRWTQPPERFLERLLARVLFEDLGLPHLVGGLGTTLDVRLVALDEVRLPERLARAQAVASLRNDRRVIWEETLTVDVPIVAQPDEKTAGKDGKAAKKKADPAKETVEALGEALRGLAARIADRVLRQNEAPEAR